MSIRHLNQNDLLQLLTLYSYLNPEDAKNDQATEVWKKILGNL